MTAGRDLISGAILCLHDNAGDGSDASGRSTGGGAVGRGTGGGAGNEGVTEYWMPLRSRKKQCIDHNGVEDDGDRPQFIFAQNGRVLKLLRKKFLSRYILDVKIVLYRRSHCLHQLCFRGRLFFMQDQSEQKRHLFHLLHAT